MERDAFIVTGSAIYRLEPGDGTSYTFMLTPLLNTGQVLSGIGDGSRYVLLTILMAWGSGSAIVDAENLIHLHQGTLGYLREHGMDQVHPVTLIACALAAGQLLQDPADLQRAVKAMRRVAEFLPQD